MKLRKSMSSLFFAALAIPFSQEEWKILEYGKIPPNKVTFEEGQMKVSVDNSNNPIIYPLKEVKEISGFEVELKISGQTPPPLSEGQWDDDASFRIGFVAEGEKKMGKVSLFFSPDWVKELFKMAPQGGGIDKIYFFNLGRSPQKVGQFRTFPGTKNLVQEEIIALEEKGETSYQLKHKFKQPLRVAGLWLSMDGDVTKAKFEVNVLKIVLLEPSDKKD